jgi:para-aminobenzoate synthetase component 1
MKRIHSKYAITLDDQFRKKLLLWAQQFDEVAWLDSNHYQQGHVSYQAILAVDAFTSLQTDYHNAFQKLDEFQSSLNDWLFGYLTYDLKNDIEDLSSQNYDGLGFPDLLFFQPKRLFLFSENGVDLLYLNMAADEMEADWKEINEFPFNESSSLDEHQTVKISLRTSKDNYFEEVNRMLAHIERGDIYEANFCQEFFSEDIVIDPVKTFDHLNEISRPPFATFLKFGNNYAMSASPERYLK